MNVVYVESLLSAFRGVLSDVSALSMLLSRIVRRRIKSTCADTLPIFPALRAIDLACEQTQKHFKSELQRFVAAAALELFLCTT